MVRNRSPAQFNGGRNVFAARDRSEKILTLIFSSFGTTVAHIDDFQQHANLHLERRIIFSHCDFKAGFATVFAVPIYVPAIFFFLKR